MNATSAVFDSFGLLEHIFSFMPVCDLLNASYISERWKEAARSDFLWKKACRLLWKGKWALSHITDESELPLFWRSYLTTETIAGMNVEQIRAFYRHPLLELNMENLGLSLHLEESMMQSAFHLYMTNVRNLELRDLWFASYSSSVFDSTRADILDSELCSPRGFDTYFKIDPNDVTDTDFLENLVPYDYSDVLLYPHSICYFMESQEFAMEPRDGNMRNSTDLKWARTVDRSVRVGPYPPLRVTRQQDWGWTLENMHVVLYARRL